MKEGRTEEQLSVAQPAEEIPAAPKKGRLKKIDSYQKHIIFTDGTRIAFADLRQLDSDLLPFSADLDFLE